MTLSIAVSVEWWARYSDCSSGSRLFSVRYSVSCYATSRSSSLDKTEHRPRRGRFLQQWRDVARLEAGRDLSEVLTCLLEDFYAFPRDRERNRRLITSLC